MKNGMKECHIKDKINDNMSQKAIKNCYGTVFSV